MVLLSLKCILSIFSWAHCWWDPKSWGAAKMIWTFSSHMLCMMELGLQFLYLSLTSLIVRFLAHFKTWIYEWWFWRCWLGKGLCGACAVNFISLSRWCHRRMLCFKMQWNLEFHSALNKMKVDVEEHTIFHSYMPHLLLIGEGMWVLEPSKLPNIKILMQSTCTAMPSWHY